MSVHSRVNRTFALALAALMLPLLPNVPSAQAATVGTIVATPSQPVSTELVKVKVDFPGSYPVLTLFETAADPGAPPVTWTKVAGAISKKSNSSGVYTFSYRMPDHQVWLQALKDNTTDASPILSLTPVPTTAVLDPIVDNGTGTRAKATAHFTPVRSGQATQLQIMTLSTYPLNAKKTKPADDAVTNEVCDPVTTATDPLDNGTCNARPGWKTIASSTQNSSGNSTFTLTNPLEISHEYRVVTGPSGGSKTASDLVTYAAGKTTKNTGLATVYLNTNEGASINTRTRYFRGTFEMTAGAFNCTAVPQMAAAAKGRGNYSWTFPRKSYTLKLGSKTDLCGMGASKKWALVSDEYDKTLVRNATSYYLGSKFTNMAWNPRNVAVDLYINGSYRGSYMLVERIALATNRIDQPAIANPGASDNVGGAYILEWDNRKGADHNITAGARGWVGIKEPENDKTVLNPIRNTGKGITTGQVNYINSYLDQVDATLFGSNFKNPTTGWRKYIDEASAVDYYLAMEFLKPVDGNMWASVYMYKAPDSVPNARDGKLYFGPMWDFDLGLGSAKREGNVVSPTGWYLRNQISIPAKQSTVTWFNRLNQDPAFRAAVSARWKQLYAGGLKADVINWYNTRVNTIHASAVATFKVWPVTERLGATQVIKGSLSAEVTYLRSWLNSRFNWINGQIG